MTDFQQNKKRNSCFVTISNILQVKYCCLATGITISVYKKSFLAKNY